MIRRANDDMIAYEVGPIRLSNHQFNIVVVGAQFVFASELGDGKNFTLFKLINGKPVF